MSEPSKIDDGGMSRDMTMRQLIAISAMASMLGRPDVKIEHVDMIIKLSFGYADIFIAEGKKP